MKNRADSHTAKIEKLLDALQDCCYDEAMGGFSQIEARKVLEAAFPSETAPTRDAVLEEAAVACLGLWKSAPNDGPYYTQNKISHGCVASAATIRALKNAAPQGCSQYHQGTVNDYCLLCGHTRMAHSVAPTPKGNEADWKARAERALSSLRSFDRALADYIEVQTERTDQRQEP